MTCQLSKLVGEIAQNPVLVCRALLHLSLGDSRLVELRSIFLPRDAIRYSEHLFDPVQKPDCQRMGYVVGIMPLSWSLSSVASFG